MGFIDQLSSLVGKKSDYAVEYKRYKKGMERNPSDIGLKTQFIKFCLLNRFTQQDVGNEHIAEALRLFESVQNSDSLDLQCHYLAGKYYQEDKDSRKAYQVYLNAIRRFNQVVGENPDLKSENAELAYSVALNLMNLQWNPVAPEVEVCFKIIRKSFPLHLKRIEFEQEMAKPAPDKARIKQLAEEIRKLKAEEDKEQEAAAAKGKEAHPAAAEKAAQSSPAKSKEPKGIFSKLFSELAPSSLGLSLEAGPQVKQEGGEGRESFSLSLPAEQAQHGSAFMVFHDDHWEGPYTVSQLKTMGFLRHSTWVCRDGSQQVMQAYEVSDLQPLFQFQR
ncbi:MAG TPA: hypothetical protein VJ873_05185 [bacterium]|nr:hypothetical protein [bacterium]